MFGYILSSPPVNRLLHVSEFPTGRGQCGPCSGTCRTEADCRMGECCSNGKCVFCVPCVDASRCPQGQCCLKGAVSPSKMCTDDCDTGVCENNLDCTSRICKNGKCIIGPREPPKCDRATDCDPPWLNGKDQCCLKSGPFWTNEFRCGDCDRDGVCSDNSHCRDHLRCDTHQRCVCGRDYPCTNGQVCDATGNCVSKPCSGREQCSPGQCCLKRSWKGYLAPKLCGNCEGFCEDDFDCKEGHTCEGGRCVIGGCLTDSQCHPECCVTEISFCDHIFHVSGKKAFRAVCIISNILKSRS